MFAKRSRWGQRLFTQRQILVKSDGRVSYMTLGRHAQMAMVLGGVAAVALIGVGVASLTLEWGGGGAGTGPVALDAGRGDEFTTMTEQLRHQLAAAEARLTAAQAEIRAQTEAQAQAEARYEAQSRAMAQLQAELQTQLRLQAALAPAAPVAETAGDSTATERRALAEARDRALAERDRALAERDDLNSQIASLQEQRNRAIAERDDLHRQVTGLQDTASDKSSHLTQLTRTLEANRGELRQSEAQRNAAQAKIRQLEAELDGASTRSSQYKANLESIERKLQQLAAEHDKTIAERDRLQARVSELQTRALGPSATAPSKSGATDAAKAPNPPTAVPRAFYDRVPGQHSEDTGAAPGGDLERLIASTGVDVERLLGPIGAVPTGEGGPFVALDRMKMTPGQESERVAELQKLVKALPLGMPLTNYHSVSGFGERTDPFHRGQAFHTGIDLAAPYRSPIYSTGPGVVSFTGVKEGYGKVIEVDHGHGIVTRYAHLHRIVVAHGQRVRVHEQIGELGSTGRSTGPHVHYEVIVNGTPLDPDKFMQAGKNVVQAGGH